MSDIRSEAVIGLPSEAPGVANRAGLSILVVEDNDGDAYLIERALSSIPAVGGIVRAPNGLEALDLVDQGGFKPDIAFIDLNMPKKNGFNLLVEFACRQQPCFPMVVLTSSTAQQDAMRSRLRGASRVLSKPDTIEELTVLLTAAIVSACPGSMPPPGLEE